MLLVLVFVLALVEAEPDVLSLAEPDVLPPEVAGVDPGWTIAPPLAPSVPVVVAPWPLFTVVSLDRSVLPEADTPVGVVVELLVVVCAMAPPASSEATRRLRSLLMR
jgi:hypothetical protein